MTNFDTWGTSDFICSTINSFAEPVNVVVMPNATTPCYAHVLVPNPNVPGAFNDLRITVFTWKPNGTAAPNVSFAWRCRLLSIQIILWSPRRANIKGEWGAIPLNVPFRGARMARADNQQCHND
jgi:hypothetical protein